MAVTASGTFDHWPASAWAEGTGVAIKAERDKGKLSVTVAPDAAPGVHWLRLYDREGATALRPFVVGTLPEVAESEPNDDPRKPQRIDGPAVTVNGRLAKRGDVDGFAVALGRGQALAADLVAHRQLGSPMDGVLQVVSASGFVLAQNDDTAGRDPRIVFEAPADGTYVVRVFAFPATPDSSIHFAGGEAFFYRLTLTTRGFLDHAFPPAVARDGPRTVAAVGPNVPDSARTLTVPTADDDRDVVRLAHPLLAGTIDVRRFAGRATVEAEPNDPGRPQEVPDRGVVGGRIDPPGERDAFRVILKKGEKRTFRIEAQALGLPLDALLRVMDAGGKVLAESDDVGERRDPELAFTAPADGAYRITVQDLNGRGGPRFAYALAVVAPEPDFALTLATDHIDARPGKTVDLAVTIDRKDGFAAPIELNAVDLPPGVSASPVVSRAGDASAKSVTLRLSADGCPHPGPFRVVGKATGSPTRTHAARAAIAGFDASTDSPWLSVLPAP